MKKAEDFRRTARGALAGNWVTAVVVGLVAALLGGVVFENSGVKFNFDLSNAEINMNFAGREVFSVGNGINTGFGAFVIGGITYIVIIALIMAVIYFVLGSFIGVGYARFNLDLVDRKKAGFESLFAYFSYWKTTSMARLLQSVYILLWSLLLVVPGIVAAYSYAMTDYILAENPELTATEAIEQSKEMMRGNRWRLFCLEFSFIGWHILAAIVFGIGDLLLTPYIHAAKAAFYRDISGSGDYSDKFEADAGYSTWGETNI